MSGEPGIKLTGIRPFLWIPPKPRQRTCSEKPGGSSSGSAWVREEFRGEEQIFWETVRRGRGHTHVNRVLLWTYTLSRETVVCYLLGSDFLCLTLENPLYYRTSINKRKREELSMNTCRQAARQHQSCARGADSTVWAQTHTESFGCDSAEDCSGSGPQTEGRSRAEADGYETCTFTESCRFLLISIT